MLKDTNRQLVTGAGIIGNLWLAVLHHHGVRGVTVSEPSTERRSITDRLGLGARVIDPASLAGME